MLVKQTMTELRRDDLPLWMQKALRGTDWGVLIVLALSLIAAWPFLLQPGLPLTNASEHYVYRAADDAQALGEGRLYPRWSPNALGGYGAPIPEYYPPSAAYLPALLDVFLTDDATLAVRLTFAAALCLAGCAVYAFVTRRSGAKCGVLAALLYVYSPYIGLVAPELLGDLPGVIALMLIPALLWSVDRLLRANRPPDLLYVAAITAALVLTDVPAAVVGWALAAALLASDSADYPRWYLALIGGGIGVALAACFWLPALLEADAVQWYARPLVIPQTLTLGGLFAPLRPLDPDALIAPPQFALGLALPLATLASLPVIVRRRLGFHALFLILGLALIVLALAVFPSEVWLLGVITLCLSIGASAVAAWSSAHVVLPILAVLVLVAALPIWLAPRWSNAPIDTSPLAEVQYEQQGYGIAGLPDGAALPASIPPDTPPDRALLASYRSGLVNKIEPDSAPQIGVLAHTSHSDQFQVQTLTPLTLNLLTAYFPGWSASLNDTPLPVLRSATSLMTVSVPGGARGELTISLDSTPPRTLGWIVSWLALLLIGALTITRSRRSSERYEPLELLPAAQARLLALVVVGFAAVLLLVAVPFAPLPVTPQPDYALAGSSTLDDYSDAGLEVLAYRLDKSSVQPGDTIHLTLYWHTLRFLTDSYRLRLALLDLKSGAYLQTSDLVEPGGYPTSRWLPRLYVTDPHVIPLPSDFPAGQYSPALEVCAADCMSGDRLTFLNRSGSAYGPVLVLPYILTVG